MKTATAKDLRVRTAALLDDVRRGHEVLITYRGRSVAVLAPVCRLRRKDLVPVGFGMWRGRREMQDVERWVKRLRTPRRGRSSSTPAGQSITYVRYSGYRTCMAKDRRSKREKLTASQLRADVYRVLDRVLESGIPAEIERKGRVLRIVPESSSSRLSRLVERPTFIKGDPNDLVHLDWSAD